MDLPTRLALTKNTLDDYYGDFGMAILDGWNLIAYRRDDGTLLTIYEPEGIKPVEDFAKEELIKPSVRWLNHLVSIFMDLDEIIGEQNHLLDFKFCDSDDEYDWEVFYDFIKCQSAIDGGCGSYIIENRKNVAQDFRQAVMDNKVGIKDTQSSFNICVPCKF